jgi:two-component system CheB/CheR fusion protein
METPSMTTRLVVMGASSGGIEALTVVLGGLPEDFSAPIVVAQHLDPRRPSRLREIFATRTRLQVRTVDGQTRLEPGVVHIVPADRDVTIADHTVSLAEGHHRPKPSIDRLLESAAANYGEGLIAVILSGDGVDGSEGAKRVQEAGGPSSSRIRAPRAIPRCRCP